MLYIPTLDSAFLLLSSVIYFHSGHLALRCIKRPTNVRIFKFEAEENFNHPKFVSSQFNIAALFGKNREKAAHYTVLVCLCVNKKSGANKITQHPAV